MYDMKWWQKAIGYQIYPRSFFDSNADGIGDLRGIYNKIEYLKKLGIDLVWISPIFASPQVDNGYDISDYREISPDFGSMRDCEELIDALHASGIKVMLDMVLNHSSSEHRWFQESRSSRKNPLRDFYIWKPAKAGGGPPNNWVSIFGGSVWEFDETTSEYYLHLFDKKQPDFNWHCLALREELFNLTKWWLDKGIDGFRLDAITHIGKNPKFPDTLKIGWSTSSEFYTNRPEVHEYLKEMHRNVLSKYKDVVLIGEANGLQGEGALQYIAPEREELSMVFHFDHMHLDRWDNSDDWWQVTPWRLKDLKRALGNWQDSLYGKGWNCLYWQNHDHPRVVNRFGNAGEFRAKSAKMLATLLYFQQGTPFIFQGEEIGMSNLPFSDIAHYPDIMSKNYFAEQRKSGKAADEIASVLKYRARDHARSPMQWDSSSNAGFTKGENTWMSINPNFSAINVEVETKNPDSILNFYRELLRVRKEHPVVLYGSYEDISRDDENIYAYLRCWEKQMLLVIANVKDIAAVFELSQTMRVRNYELILCNYTDGVKDLNSGEIYLRPYESKVYAISGIK